LVPTPVPFLDTWDRMHGRWCRCHISTGTAPDRRRDSTPPVIEPESPCSGVFAFGPVGSLIWQRKQTDSSALNGLGNVGYTYQLGGFIDYWAVRWLRTRVEGLQGFGGAKGVTANFAVDAVVPLSPALTLSGGARARVVSSGAESPYFRITQVQSITSGLPVFNAGGGWQAVGAGTLLKYRFNPTWATYGLAEYDKLVGATASSPIVAGPGGSSNQWTFGVGLTYSFAITGLPF
jgi:MipA family protein